MTDIVKRLRGDHSDERLELAADEIERLREHCDRMASLAIDNAKDTGRAIRYREALQRISDDDNWCGQIARAALKEGE